MTDPINIEKQLSVGHAVRSGLKGLQDNAHLQRPIIFTDIHNYILGISNAATPRVVAALRSDLGVRRQYNELLKTHTQLHIPRAAAAASANIVTERETDTLAIKVVAARGRSQHYLILQVNHPDTVKDDTELVLHVVVGENSARCNFPPLQGGRTQLILDDDDPLMELVTHLNAEIFVK